MRKTGCKSGGMRYCIGMDAPQLYCHVPFCRNKCAYCAFYSLPGAGREMRRRYLDKLAAEVAAARPDPAESLYFGGGTPSLLEPEELEELFAIFARHAPLLPGAEITVEMNPETLTPEKVALIRRRATRASLGVQSFDPAIRQTLGRDCSQTALERALALLREADFPHVNCDLIYAVPGQTAAGFAADLDRAVAAGADHVSCYALTPEEGTRLADAKIVPDDDFAADCFLAAGKRLAVQGFRRYEISNYARPGGECRHNLAVWRGSRLFGFGPAAASYDGAIRFTRPADLARWLAGEAPEPDVLEAAARRREIAAVGLRTTDGWTKGRFLALPGATPEEWEDLHRRTAGLPGAWFARRGDALALAEAGLLFWDTVAEAVL